MCDIILCTMYNCLTIVHFIYIFNISFNFLLRYNKILNTIYNKIKISNKQPENIIINYRNKRKVKLSNSKLSRKWFSTHDSSFECTEHIEN